MAKIIPFRGILYNVSKVSMEDVMAPPYDIITPEYREALYMQSHYNVVKIDFGKEETGDNETKNKYTRARGYLDAWIKEGIFIRSGKPSLYVYEMSYMIHDVKKHLLGFLCLVKLEELGKGSIYPHECTHSKPKQDRLNLMRSCQANTSPIFSLYKSQEEGISKILSKIFGTKPYIESADISGDTHRLWQIDDTNDIEIIKKELEDKAIFIADGHHRYETAFEFYREMSAKDASTTDRPFDHVLMFLANMLDEGITILPTHRLLKEIPKDLNKILHTSEIGYEMDVNRALDKVKSGEFSAAFFLNPTKVEDVEKSALSAVRMPPKSTYFYPKLLTGLVISKF